MCAKRTTLTASMSTISGSARNFWHNCCCRTSSSSGKTGQSAYLQLCIEKRVVVKVFFFHFHLLRSALLLHGWHFSTCLPLRVLSTLHARYRVLATTTRVLFSCCLLFFCGLSPRSSWPKRLNYSQLLRPIVWIPFKEFATHGTISVPRLLNDVLFLDDGFGGRDNGF